MASTDGLVAIDKVILGEGYTSSETYRNLEALCGFGSRFGGTSGEKPAVDYLVSRMKEYGLENVRAEPFQYVGWVRGPGRVTTTAPEEREFSCITLPHVGDFDVEGPLVFVGYGTPSEMEAYADRIPGSIVMSNSESPVYFRSLHRREKISRAAELGARGFIFMREEGGLLPETGSTRTNEPAEMPVVGVSREEGMALRRLQRKGPVTVRVWTKGEVREMTSWHVVGELTGQTMPDRIMVVGAHFDGHDISVGAMDDGSGAVIVLEVARLLSMHRPALARTLRFICFPLEEIALAGSFKYVLNHVDEMDSVDFMFNLDSAGRGEGGIALQGCSELIPTFREITSSMNHPTVVDNSVSMSSDHFPFALAGVPAASLTNMSASRTNRGYSHTAADTLDKVSLRNMQHAAVQVARVMVRAAGMTSWPGRHRSQDEIVRVLDRFGLRETVRLVRYPSIPGRFDMQRL